MFGVVSWHGIVYTLRTCRADPSVVLIALMSEGKGHVVCADEKDAHRQTLCADETDAPRQNMFVLMKRMSTGKTYVC